jgi:hypothetical protein
MGDTGSRSVPAVGRLLLAVVKQCNALARFSTRRAVVRRAPRSTQDLVGALLRALAKDVAQLRLLRGASATRGKLARARIVGSEWAKVGERCVADTSFRALSGSIGALSLPQKSTERIRSAPEAN